MTATSSSTTKDHHPWVTMSDHLAFTVMYAEHITTVVMNADNPEVIGGARLSVHMSTEQARDLAAQLTAAADEAEAHEHPEQVVAGS